MRRTEGLRPRRQRLLLLQSKAYAPGRAKHRRRCHSRVPGRRLRLTPAAAAAALRPPIFGHRQRPHASVTHPSSRALLLLLQATL
jgi:hypothetical protein